MTCLLSRPARRRRATGIGWLISDANSALAPAGGGFDAAIVLWHASGSGDDDISSLPVGCDNKVAATQPPAGATADLNDAPQPTGSSTHVGDSPPHAGGGGTDDYTSLLEGGARTDANKPAPVRRRDRDGEYPPSAGSDDNKVDASALADRAGKACITLVLAGGITAADNEPPREGGAGHDDQEPPPAGTGADTAKDVPRASGGAEADGKTPRMDGGGTGACAPLL